MLSASAKRAMQQICLGSCTHSRLAVNARLCPPQLINRGWLEPCELKWLVLPELFTYLQSQAMETP